MSDSALFDTEAICGKGRCCDNECPGKPGVNLTVGKVYEFLDIDERVNAAVVIDDCGSRIRVRFDRFEVIE